MKYPDDENLYVKINYINYSENYSRYSGYIFVDKLSSTGFCQEANSKEGWIKTLVPISQHDIKDDIRTLRNILSYSFAIKDNKSGMLLIKIKNLIVDIFLYDVHNQKIITKKEYKSMKLKGLKNDL